MTRRFVVQFDYVSALGGPWGKGEVIEIDEKLAKALTNDRPGLLKEYVEQKNFLDASQDRMVRQGKRRGR